MSDGTRPGSIDMLEREPLTDDPHLVAVLRESLQSAAGLEDIIKAIDAEVDELKSMVRDLFVLVASVRKAVEE